MLISSPSEEDATCWDHTAINGISDIWGVSSYTIYRQNCIYVLSVDWSAVKMKDGHSSPTLPASRTELMVPKWAFFKASPLVSKIRVASPFFSGENRKPWFVVEETDTKKVISGKVGENVNHVALTSLTWNGRVKSYSSSFLLGIYRFNFTLYRFKNLTPPKLLDCHLDSRSRSNSCVGCLLLIHLHPTCHKCMFKFILSSYNFTSKCWANALVLVQLKAGMA